MPYRSIRMKEILGGLLFGAAFGASAADTITLRECASIAEDAARLRCFDLLAAAAQPVSLIPAAAEPLPPATRRPALADDRAGLAAGEARTVTPLSSRWELDPESKHGTWSFRPHKPNYFLFARYTDSVNQRPYVGHFKGADGRDEGLDPAEVKFQLSFKTKAAENLFGRGADLWFGYTQQNSWQLYNSGISAPFRETNYEPEIFVTVPTDYPLLGLRGRFVNFGFSHQSNGRSEPLSRSWNRLYAQAGFEYGDKFQLILKPWYRIRESADSDDNPGINRYVGDYEAEASYRFGSQTLSLLGRSTWDAKRGFLQLDWTFPLSSLLQRDESSQGPGQLKGYVQFTTGYGESMIDYNHRQDTIGFGVLLTDWM